MTDSSKWREINGQKYCTSGGEKVADFLQDQGFYKSRRRAAHSHRTIFIVYIEHDYIKQLTTYRERKKYIVTSWHC